MRWIPRSLAGQMAVIAVPGILAAAGGLAWFAWSMADDEHRLAGIAESVHRGALESAGRQAAGLGDISAAAAAHADAVREIQIEFRLQVLAFKSLLIRGERPDQREKFQGEFELRARNVQDRLRSLQAALAGDTQAVALLTAFAKAQTQLTASYRNAWGMLDLADDYNQGIHRADDYMVGRDAEPDRLLDQLTSLVLADSKRRVAQALDANRVAMAAALDAGGQRLGGAIESALERNQRCGIIAIAVLVAAGGALLWLLHRRLRPLRATAAALDGLAAGDLSARLQVRSGDEIGRMSYALNRSLEAIATTLGSRRVDWQAISAARGRHAKRLGQDLLRTAEEMEQVSLQVASDGREIDGQAGRVNAEWLRIGQDIQAMAAAIEELDASLGTVAGNSQRSSEAVGRTNGHAVAAAKAVEEMLQAANQVGEAVQLIAKISSQVNLLALNATIEAARAGEAGRGFTVVANEVKHLAGDTRTTADEIAARVETMQAASRRSAEAIRAITELMDTAAPLVAEVGSEVAQQAATVSSVSTSISRVAHDGRDLQAAAERLARTTTAATVTADATREAAQVLKRLSADLREVLGQDDAAEADVSPEARRPMTRELVGAA